MDDTQPPETAVVLEPDLCTTQFARIGRQALVLGVRNEVLALRDGAFGGLSVYGPLAAAHRRMVR